jgi:hypothetical protein
MSASSMTWGGESGKACHGMCDGRFVFGYTQWHLCPNHKIKSTIAVLEAATLRLLVANTTAHPPQPFYLTRVHVHVYICSCPFVFVFAFVFVSVSVFVFTFTLVFAFKYVLLDQVVFVAVLPAHPCQNNRVAL